PETISVVVPSLRPGVTGWTLNPDESARNTAAPVPMRTIASSGTATRTVTRSITTTAVTRRPGCQRPSGLGSTTRPWVVRVSTSSTGPTYPTVPDAVTVGPPAART